MASGVNISELAKHCDVSPSTVSRVFNGALAVNPKTRQKILKAAHKMNYSPQQTARQNNVAIIVPHNQSIQPPSWFATEMFGGLMKGIYEIGYVPRLFDVDNISLIQANFTVALITLMWNPGDDENELLAKIKRPIININNHMPFAHSVCTDHADGILQAMNYLIDRGHRRIGLLNAHANTWGNIERLRGYKKALEMADIPFDENLVCQENPDCSLSMDGLSDLLVQRKVTGLVCGHESWTLPIRYYLNLLGKQVPEDVSLICGEVPSINQWLNPPLTSINQDSEQIVKSVIEMIHDLTKNKSETGKLYNKVLPYHLIERRSVKSIVT